MPTPRTPKKPAREKSIGESVDILSEAIAGFDFGIHEDDFVLYELNRLIEEERASFEDEEFRILIDEGIREHIEENLPVRARLAGALRTAAPRLDPPTRTVAERVIRALENAGYDLRNAGVIVRAYTSCLFEKLQLLEDTSKDEAVARTMLESWKNGAVSNEPLIENLVHIGRPAIGPTADILLLSLESPEGRNAAETALAVLSSIRSSVSARVLAYVVSEPMLDEDLEARAYSALREFWLLARPFILYKLHSHAHEDLPFRWFQLLIEVDETSTTDLLYEEMRMHGDQPSYLEDLWALATLMARSRDPEIEDRVLEWINSPKMPQPVVPILEEFLKEYPRPNPKERPAAWVERSRLLDLNEKYVTASRLWDAGKKEDARRALAEILARDPGYPFALMLKKFL
ncbi:MAG TPA: hypothetical protein VK210_15210 [Terriglobia bacterium]|nr:hypothetical protein [Terriglobia bacterium]